MLKKGSHYVLNISHRFMLFSYLMDEKNENETQESACVCVCECVCVCVKEIERECCVSCLQ